MNHLEELVSEWLEFNGYFVRRNVLVGKRPNGGYECELDVVAFHPLQRRLVHVEPSLDAHAWEKRETRFAKKFAAGKRHIPGMFEGLGLPATIDQIALLVFASTTGRTTLGGGRILHVSSVYREILAGIRDRRVESKAVPEQFPLIRTIQQCQQYGDVGASTMPDMEGDGIGIARMDLVTNADADA